ncbi:hypothetical protein AA650_20130 [Anabaena sp. WA102]|nr:hypothetical protein AA650_20130 [Anabaena sp. WA102]
MQEVQGRFPKVTKQGGRITSKLPFKMHKTLIQQATEARNEKINISAIFPDLRTTHFAIIKTTQ